ncbi:MAG: polysaccharide deacetylase family protein [Methylocystaceae bacterium]
MKNVRFATVLVAVLLISAFILGGDQIWEKPQAITTSGANQKVSPSPQIQPEPRPNPEPVKLVDYHGPIYHVFFHSLIAFPEIAYASNGGRGSLDRDCITVTEFKRTLDELYKNNYVLIDMHSTYLIADENGKTVVKDKQLKLPPGKKPLVMSVDDMVYDPKKMGTGMVDKVILDDKGQLATYTRQRNGEEVISHDNDIIPILEQFVGEHPDFSFQGAKATLALTGWVGILGYRIEAGASNRESEVLAVKPIVEKLKQDGWNFACHGYGHYDANKITAARFDRDTRKWKAEIEPVVGPTDIYVYPYGAIVPVNGDHYQVLLGNGFRFMCGVDMRPYWKNFGASILMGRQAVDGYTLRHHQQLLAPLLDTNLVFDAESRRSTL